MSVQNGDVVILQIGGVQVGALVSNSQNMTADMLDKTNKDTPGIKAYDAGEDGWTLSVEALWDPAATEGFSEVLGYLKAGTEITVLHGITGTETSSGTGLIASVDVSGPKNEISSYSLEIQGTGELNIGYGPELHTDANAASDPNGNEANATTGWTQQNLDVGANVFESQSSIVNTGTYALHGNCNDTPTSGSRFQIIFTCVIGETYRITGNHRHVGSGGLWAISIQGSTVGTVANTVVTFQSLDEEFVASTTTVTLRFAESNASNDGGMYVDNVSCKKKL